MRLSGIIGGEDVNLVAAGPQMSGKTFTIMVRTVHYYQKDEYHHTHHVNLNRAQSASSWIQNRASKYSNTSIISTARIVLLERPLW